MMKVARSVFKALAVLLALATALCLIVSYWDKICELFACAAAKLKEKKAQCPLCSSEYEDYADWE